MSSQAMWKDDDYPNEHQYTNEDIVGVITYYKQMYS